VPPARREKSSAHRGPDAVAILYIEDCQILEKFHQEDKPDGTIKTAAAGKASGEVARDSVENGANPKGNVRRLRDRDPHLFVGHISLFESGGRVPSLLVLLAYARVSHISLESLLDDTMSLQESAKHMNAESAKDL
jgi:hypothetical protein